MIPQQGTWADLHVGAYMKDQTGKTWKITHERDFHFRIEDRDGNAKMLRPRDPRTPVTIVVPTEAEAVATLESKLDATTLADKANGSKVWQAGPFREKGPGALTDGKAHLYLMHGTWANDIKDMAGVVEAHEYFHANPDHSLGRVPHVH